MATLKQNETLLEERTGVQLVCVLDVTLTLTITINFNLDLHGYLPGAPSGTDVFCLGRKSETFQRRRPHLTENAGHDWTGAKVVFAYFNHVSVQVGYGDTYE